MAASSRIPIPARLAALVVAAGVAACSSPGSAVPSPGPSGASASPLPTAASPSLDATPSPTPVNAGVAAGLAFVREVSGVPQVFVVEPDGTARQVTGLGDLTSVAVVRPFWSPDRSQLGVRPKSFGSGPDPQLWVVNADGTDQRTLGTVGESIGWSPDSTHLLYQDSVLTTDTTGEPARIWLVEVASGEATVIGRGDMPQWLPDGERYSYTPVRTGLQPDTFPIVVAPLAGGDPVQVAIGQGAWWSPDGTALLLQQPDGLWVAEPDGSDARHLVEGAAPVWSPDGTRVIFAYDHTSDALPIIGVVDRDGNVVWDGQVGTDPVWSPDGSMVAAEIGYPEVSIAIYDAATGEVIWEVDGEDPAW